MHDVSMQTQLLIGGEWRDGAGAERFDVENTANEEVIDNTGQRIENGKLCRDF